MPTLNWIGKEKILTHHREVAFRELVRQYYFGDEPQSISSEENMIIHGDNLEALKALLPKYEKRINCIYIDPPYNTGKENWVYNDKVNDPHIKKWLGEVVGAQGDDLSRDDKWLCMMYPRLRLLEKLMSEDASLVISIGYHELHSLIYLCKEIFPTKQVIPITVQTSGGKPSGGFNYLHEYIVFVVSKDFNPNALDFCGGTPRRPFEGLTLSTFTKENRPNQTYPIFIDPEKETIVGVGKSLQELIDEGLYQGEKKDFIYDFTIAPSGTVAVWPITSKGKDCVWRQISSRVKTDWEKGYIKVSKNNTKGHPNQYSVQYLPEGLIKKIQKGTLEVIGHENGKPTLILGENTTEGSSVPTIWLEKNFYTVKGTQTLKDILPEADKHFDYPKSPELIQAIIQAISKEDDIILDSFAGSGTTGQAVLDLNSIDGGDRKFILIEMMEYADSITAERIRRVIKGYGSESNLVEGTGGAFNYYELGEKFFTEDGLLNENISEEKIREYVYYTETRRPLTRPRSNNSFLLDTFNNTGFYFYYKPNEVTTFGPDTLKIVTERADSYVVYADKCTLSEDYMLKHNIVFKKIPRDIKQF